MWRWRRVAVARVFALVVRCRIMTVVLFILALAKTVTPGGSPRREPGQARTADHLAVLFSQKVLAVRKANDIYRPVRTRLYYFAVLYLLRMGLFFIIL